MSRRRLNLLYIQFRSSSGLSVGFIILCGSWLLLFLGPYRLFLRQFLAYL